jgi:hypothetical protein
VCKPGIKASCHAAVQQPVQQPVHLQRFQHPSLPTPNTEGLRIVYEGPCLAVTGEFTARYGYQCELHAQQPERKQHAEHATGMLVLTARAHCYDHDRLPAGNRPISQSSCSSDMGNHIPLQLQQTTQQLQRNAPSTNACGPGHNRCTMKRACKVFLLYSTSTARRKDKAYRISHEAPLNTQLDSAQVSNTGTRVPLHSWHKRLACKCPATNPHQSHYSSCHRNWCLSCR